MLTLALGDLYIPERAIDIPSKFKKLLSPNPQNYPTNSKISKVVCLGNITNSPSTLRFLHDISPHFQLVNGEFDDPVVVSQQLDLIIESHQLKNSRRDITATKTKIPMYTKIVHDDLKIGFTNGYQIMPRGDPLQLSALAREMDVDILVWGGTHKVEAYVLDNKFFINPGSITGAFSFDWPEQEEEEDEEDGEGEVDVDNTSANELADKEDRENITKMTNDDEETKEANNETGIQIDKDQEKEQNVKKDDPEVKVEASNGSQDNLDTAEKGSDEKSVEEEEKDEKEEKENTEKPLAEKLADIQEADRKAKEQQQQEQYQKAKESEMFKRTLHQVTELNTSIPSFVLLDSHGSTCILYIYTLFDNEVKVDKVTYTKE